MGKENSQSTLTPEQPFDKWKTRRTADSLKHANIFCDRIWDAFAIPEEIPWLWKKIALAFCSVPNDETRADLGLTEEQKELIDDVVKKSIIHSVNKSEVCIAVIFMFIYLDDDKDIQLPLIRVRKHSNRNLSEIPNNVFIDIEGRVYRSWTEYKENSTFDRYYQLGPKNGYYSMLCDCLELIPPVTFAQVKHGLDIASTATGVASGVGLLAGIVLILIPFTAPVGAVVLTGSAVAGASSSAYGVGRSIGWLVDKAQHDQFTCISLTNSAATDAWRGTRLSFLLFYHSIITSKRAPRGSEFDSKGSAHQESGGRTEETHINTEFIRKLKTE